MSMDYFDGDDYDWSEDEQHFDPPPTPTSNEFLKSLMTDLLTLHTDYRRGKQWYQHQTVDARSGYAGNYYISIPASLTGGTYAGIERSETPQWSSFIQEANG